MNTVLINTFHSSVGSFPAGTHVSIKLAGDFVAEIQIENLKLSISTESLWRYFSGFVRITPELIRKYRLSGCAPSLTGKMVECDGHDPEGWPSILLASGVI